MLTNATVKAARAGARPYKIGDAGGLYLYVRPNGRRTWRMKFRYQRREKLLTFGDFPELGLGDARERRDQAREQLRRGVDPALRSGTAPELQAETSFEAIARRWHERRRPRWSDVHAGDVITSLERHVFPAIGGLPIASIDAMKVLRLLLAIEARGCSETARRIRQRISAVFRYAITIRAANEDPALLVKDELSPPPVQRRHPALLEIGAARELLAAAELVDVAPIAKLASRFLALTAVRLAALRGAKWEEFDGGDGRNWEESTEPLWRVPAARMKLTKIKKADPAAEHLVPLSREAVEILRAARRAGGGSAFVFPGRDGRRPIGEAAIGDLYARAALRLAQDGRPIGKHVPHGWRATFSTILNEMHPEDRALIDRALAHVPKDKVEAAYNRAQHLVRLRSLFQRWAELLANT